MTSKPAKSSTISMAVMNFCPMTILALAGTIPVRREPTPKLLLISAKAIGRPKYQLIAFLTIYKEFHSWLRDGLTFGIVCRIVSDPSKIERQ